MHKTTSEQFLKNCSCTLKLGKQQSVSLCPVKLFLYYFRPNTDEQQQVVAGGAQQLFAAQQQQQANLQATQIAPNIDPAAGGVPPQHILQQAPPAGTPIAVPGQQLIQQAPPAGAPIAAPGQQVVPQATTNNQAASEAGQPVLQFFGGYRTTADNQPTNTGQAPPAAGVAQPTALGVDLQATMASRVSFRSMKSSRENM